MIDLVVFDIAGTTVYDGDTVNCSFRAALSAAGLDVAPDRVTEVMGLTKTEAVRRLLEASGETPGEDRIETIHADFVERMQTYYRESPEVREVPGASETFRELRSRGVAVALDTGFPRAIVEPILSRLGWDAPGVLDAWIASDEVARGRPAPDMIRSLMARLRIDDPACVAKVGDTRADLEEGTTAGCAFVIGVCTGAFTRAQLEALPHTHVVESVVEVPRLLREEAPAIR